jgi:hypothetical protein
MKGTRAASQNRNWPNEITWSAPDKILSVMTLPQTTIRQAAAGDKGWGFEWNETTNTHLGTSGNCPAVGLEDVFSAVKVTLTPGMQVADTEKIDGRDVWVVVKSTPETT